MHAVKIETDEDGHTRLLLDGQDISKRCLRFRLEQEGGEAPELNLCLLCDSIEFAEQSEIDVKTETAPAVTGVASIGGDITE